MTEPTPIPADSPVQGFAHCHAGIIGHLQQLGTLPELLEPARRAREIAARTLKFFDEVIVEHHAEEERELFPAVLASATKGEERDRVRGITERLTHEHRQIEAAWKALAPPLKVVAKGGDAALDAQAVAALVNDYLGHARYEEAEFLPLSQEILARNGNHLAALGLSLHLRHSVPEVLARYGSRI